MKEHRLIYRSGSASAGRASVAVAHAAGKSGGGGGSSSGGSKAAPKPALTVSFASPQIAARAAANAAKLQAKGVTLNERGQAAIAQATPQAVDLARKLNSPSSVNDLANTESLDVPQGFSDDFVKLVGGLPPDVQGKVVSSYQAFQNLAQGDQKNNVNAWMDFAKTQVKAKIDQDRQRQKDAYNATVAKSNQERQNAQTNYDHFVGNLDTNHVNDLAKENKTLADTLQTISSTSFATSVAGSGIVSRRFSKAAETPLQNIGDINTKYGQDLGSAQDILKNYLTMNQIEGDRQKTLEDQSMADLDQKQNADSTSLFLTLFANQMGSVQSDINKNLDSGTTTTAPRFAIPGDVTSGAAPAPAAPVSPVPPPRLPSAGTPAAITRVTNPNTGVSYSGGAASRLQQRLNKKAAASSKISYQ